MTREEALAIVVATVGQRVTSLVESETVEMAHKVIRSEKDEKDLGIGVEGQPRGDVRYSLRYVGSAHSAEILTYEDLLDECEAAAEYIDSGSVDLMSERWRRYVIRRGRRERLMGSRSSTATDKGKGGDDRAS